jgi:hypothetical protein
MFETAESQQKCSSYSSMKYEEHFYGHPAGWHGDLCHVCAVEFAKMAKGSAIGKQVRFLPVH